MKPVFLISILAFGLMAFHSANAATRHDWGLIYVMSYDNNLDHAAEPIVKRLKRGITNDRVAVSILMDRMDQEGLKKLLFSHQRNKEVRLKTEDITDNLVLSDFLNWADREINARKYALIFLNHGGRLDEMCADQKIDRNTQLDGWLKASQVGPIIRQWATAIESNSRCKLEYLFLQQCGRASIENLFNFRGTANYIMASQLRVGAPNTYYTKTVRSLCKQHSISGKELGLNIMDTDRHYTSYVLIDGAELEKFGTKIQPIYHLFSQLDSAHEDLQKLKHCFEHGDERNYDLAQYLSMLTKLNGLGSSTELKTFLAWYHDDLIIKNHFSRQGKGLKWSGISTYGFNKPEHYERYRYLKIYTDTMWGEFRKALIYPSK